MIVSDLNVKMKHAYECNKWIKKEKNAKVWKMYVSIWKSGFWSCLRHYDSSQMYIPLKMELKQKDVDKRL